MNVPQGWKLVPIEPTTEMLEVGAIIAGEYYYHIPQNVYKIMILHAPKYVDPDNKKP